MFFIEFTTIIHTVGPRAGPPATREYQGAQLPSGGVVEVVVRTLQRVSACYVVLSETLNIMGIPEAVGIVVFAALCIMMMESKSVCTTNHALLNFWNGKLLGMLIWFVRSRSIV